MLTGYRRQGTDADCIHVVDFRRGSVRIASFGTRVCARVRMCRREKAPGALRARRRPSGGERQLKMACGEVRPGARVRQAHKRLPPLASHVWLTIIDRIYPKS